MASIRHILFPVDFSEQDCAIAPYVACMARQYRAQVTLIHVVDIPSQAYLGWPAAAFQAAVDERKRRVDSFLQSEFQGPAIERVMEEGDPAQSIVNFAEKSAVDLIMLPTHGYGPFRRFLLGSVTAKVLHDAKCPVWTSAHSPEIANVPAGYGYLLCAVDLTSKSLPLIQWASGFARDHGAALRLVHAIPSAAPRTGLDIEGGRFRRFLFDAAREALAKLQQEAGTTLETVLEGGDVAPVVRMAAEENHADLIVIGRGVIRESFGRLRTNVYSIVREAPCPVISVPRDSSSFEVTESYYG
jgi:nucleotide-binding universal stress UspA family protein